MSLQGTFQIIISALGVSLQGSGGNVSASEGIEPLDITIPAAQPISAWVMTDASHGAGNLPAGHGLVNGKFSAFWNAGMRYGLTGTIVGNALTLAGGAGNNFPANGEPTLIVCPETPLDLRFDGNQLTLIGAMSTLDGLLVFRDAAGAVVGSPVTLEANFPWGWTTGLGASPLAGNPVASASVSTNDTSGPAHFQFTGLQYAA
jgi:hypothetical protein